MTFILARRLIAATLATSLAASLLPATARAQDAELSLDTRRMLAYGTLAVLTRSCGTVVTGAQAAALQTGLEQSSSAQTQMSQAEFAEAMRAAGAQIGANKAEVCAAVTPAFVDKSLQEAAAGE